MDNTALNSVPSKMLEDAVALSFLCHKGQKYGDKDYFFYHILGVVEELDKHENVTDIERAVAYLHDAVEDSELTIQGLRDKGFPLEVTEAVFLLTKTNETVITDYLNAIKKNPIALRVKKSDMSFNMQNCIREDNHDRFMKYARQMKVLLS